MQDSSETCNDDERLVLLLVVKLRVTVRRDVFLEQGRHCIMARLPVQDKSNDNTLIHQERIVTGQVGRDCHRQEKVHVI